MDLSLRKLQVIVKDWEAWNAIVEGRLKQLAAEQQQQSHG